MNGIYVRHIYEVPKDSNGQPLPNRAERRRAAALARFGADTAHGLGKRRPKNYRRKRKARRRRAGVSRRITR